jgi:hypothetical protein
MIVRFSTDARSLARIIQEWVVYNELVTTTKEYMRNIIQIEPKWLTEVRE